MRLHVPTPVLAFSLVPLLACAGSDEPADAGEPVSDVGAPAPTTDGQAPPPLRVIDPATAGRIEGVVLFEGEAPKRRTIGAGSEPGCAEHTSEPLSERVIVNDGRLVNAFVWVSKGLAGVEIPAPPEEPATLDQLGCIYRPHVIGMRVGQTLSISNSDATNHNVNARPRKARDVEGRKLNRIQVPNADALEWEFDRAEVAIRLGCDLHPWMDAWVAVLEHPFFAVSAADGSFVIAGLPPGDYTVSAWHEEWPRPQKTKLTVPAAGSATATFAYPR